MLQPLCNRTHRHEPTQNVTNSASERAPAAPADTQRHATTLTVVDMESNKDLR